jgi:hypothetical protein
MRDGDNDYLAMDWLEDDPMLQIHGYWITYHIATGKQGLYLAKHCTYRRTKA